MMDKVMYRLVGTDEYSNVFEVLEVRVEEGVYCIIHMDRTLQFLPIQHYEVIVGQDEEWRTVPAVRGFLERN